MSGHALVAELAHTREDDFMNAVAASGMRTCRSPLVHGYGGVSGDMDGGCGR